MSERGTSKRSPVSYSTWNRKELLRGVETSIIYGQESGTITTKLHHQKSERTQKVSYELIDKTVEENDNAMFSINKFNSHISKVNKQQCLNMEFTYMCVRLCVYLSGKQDEWRQNTNMLSLLWTDFNWPLQNRLLLFNEPLSQRLKIRRRQLCLHNDRVCRTYVQCTNNTRRYNCTIKDCNNNATTTKIVLSNTW